MPIVLMVYLRDTQNSMWGWPTQTLISTEKPDTTVSSSVASKQAPSAQRRSGCQANLTLGPEYTVLGEHAGLEKYSERYTI